MNWKVKQDSKVKIRIKSASGIVYQCDMDIPIMDLIGVSTLELIIDSLIIKRVGLIQLGHDQIIKIEGLDVLDD